MNWLIDIFSGGGVIHSCVIISLVAALGILLGKIKIFGITLGVSFVFFVGIVAGHFNLMLDPVIAEFSQSFGLSLFVFTLGMQVGPSFFSSIRSGGLVLNLLSLLILVMNIAITIIVSIYASIPMTQMIGVLAGSVTNTASLGAAQQSLAQLHTDAEMGIYEMAYACAVSYPTGVISVIIVIAFLNRLYGKHVNKSLSENEVSSFEKTPLIVGVTIKNTDFENIKVKELQKFTKYTLIVTRILRNKSEIMTLADTVIMLNDTLLITVSKANKNKVVNLLGEESDVQWNKLESELVSRKIFVTKIEVNGKSIEALNIRKKYNVNITRVNRAGIFLIAQNDLRLFVGDRVILVGEAKNVKLVESLLGNAIKKIDEPHLVTIFTGIAFGIILGSIPIMIPGISVPIKMGLAGGTIVIGILMGVFGYRFKFNTYTTLSASLMLRELGITLYLASLGISSGKGFIESLVTGNGFQWLLWSVVISILPILIVGFIAIKLLKIDIASVFGMLCGSMASSPTLSYVSDITGNNTSSISYATVYPLTMFLRVITAQVLVMVFLG